MLRRIVLLVLALIAVAGVAGGIYFLRLTAPVDISEAPPVAPTLALGGDREAPTAAVLSATPSAAIGTASAAGTVPGRASAPATAVRASATPLGGGQLYRIIPAQSRASYSVEETFLFENNRLFTAVGVTRGIAGEILIDRANPAASRVGEIVVDVSQLTSDDSRRDNAIRRIGLESARYPRATFRTVELSGLPPAIAEGVTYTFQATGDLTIRTTTQRVTWAMTATLTGEQLRVTGTLPIKMSDFGVPPPNLSDLRVKDDVTMSLDVVALRVADN